MRTSPHIVIFRCDGCKGWVPEWYLPNSGFRCNLAGCEGLRKLQIVPVTRTITFIYAAAGAAFRAYAEYDNHDTYMELEDTTDLWTSTFMALDLERVVINYLEKHA